MRGGLIRWVGTAVGALMCAAPAVACGADVSLAPYRTIALPAGAHMAVDDMRPVRFEDREIVLTFDDGPNPGSTPAILRTLASRCVKATFFPIGDGARDNMGLLKQVAAAGHSIGGHTADHEALPGMPLARAEADIRDGFKPLKEAGIAPRLFRFPQLAATPELLAAAERQGLTVIGADIDPSDWQGDAPEVTLKRLKVAIMSRRRGVVVLHDSQPNTAAFLPDLLDWLKANDYRVSHVVAAETPAPKPGHAAP